VVDQDGTKTIIKRALEEGINFFDTADVYNNGISEEFVGAALDGQRENVVLATKVRFKMGEGPNDIGASRYHIMNGVEASLRRLKTGHIDLYQIHRWDESVRVEEMMRALDDLIRVGKIRYIGASQFAAWQLSHSNAMAEMLGWEQFVSVQAHYHLLEREVERELLPYCAYADVGLIPYYPLAGGFLTGKYKRGEPAPVGSRGERSPYVQKYLTEDNFGRLDKLRTFAVTRGHTLHELAFAWLLDNKQVPSVIAGATHPDQVSANAKTIAWKLSDDEMTELKELL